MERNYTKAINDLLDKGLSLETALSGLKIRLKNKGHSKLYKHILKSLLLMRTKEESKKVPTVIVQSEKAKTLFEKPIKNALKSLDAPYEYVTEIDDTIVGGYIVRFEGSEIDMSYKKSLLTLYTRTRA